MPTNETLIAIGSILGGAGAAISACIAWKSVQKSNEALNRAREQDKRRVWTEIQTQSANARSIFRRVENVAEALKVAYQTLFAFSGLGQNSREKNYLDRIEEKRSDASRHAENSEKIRNACARLSDMDYESACDSTVRLEANAIQLSLLLDELKDELSDIQRQNDQFREQVIKSKPS